jgi:hypothetical protein
MRHAIRVLPTALAVLAALMVWGAAPARAELFRCELPDGQTIYTDSKAKCPGADPFEPKGEVQKAAERDAPGAASRAPLEDRRERAQARERAAEAEAGEARRWRQKREESEQALEQIRQRRTDLDDFVTWCNRGGSVVTRDDAGIKRSVPCKQIRSEYEDLDGEETKVRAYLDSGLAEECRKAGCLPGWIR